MQASLFETLPHLPKIILKKDVLKFGAFSINSRGKGLYLTITPSTVSPNIFLTVSAESSGETITSSTDSFSNSNPFS